MTSKIVNEVIEWQDQKNNPVVPVTKPVIQPSLTSSEQWCRDRIAKSKYKPGTFFNAKAGGIRYAFVIGYDCVKGYLFATVTMCCPQSLF